jgi:hypothetical protein
MSKEKNLVEDALIQMRNLEEAVAENAKGILASTMKQEIKELVKESIVSEQPDDEEIEDDPELSDIPDDEGDDDSEMMDMPDDEDDEDSEMMDMPDDEDDDDDEDFEMMDMPDDEEDVIDFSGNDDISDEDLLTVFKALGPEDGIIVKKDDNIINLSDEETDQEYMIRMESEDEKYIGTDEMYGEYNEYDEFGESFDVDDEYSIGESDSSDDEELKSIIDDVFSKNYSNEFNDKSDELVDDIFNSNSSEEMGEEFEEDVVYEIEVDDVEEDLYNEELEETIYEVDLDEVDESDDFEGMQMESMKPKIGKGAKIGKPKFSYKKTSGGFKEDKKQGTRGVGIGKGPKFEFKEGMKQEKKEGAHTMSKGKPSAMFHSGMSKEETKEAARTLGNGKRWGRNSLNKPKAAPTHLRKESYNRDIQQIQVLREKNEEYRKALNVFRDKLNEVAVFNSNLAYATRLFTEHSTSKQEKINILRRFDGVETLKESKNLYRTIKSELSNTTTKPSITESIERNIEKSPSSGSASTLIESKTYENPQFLRMKDIMSKIIK